MLMPTFTDPLDLWLTLSCCVDADSNTYDNISSTAPGAAVAAGIWPPAAHQIKNRVARPGLSRTSRERTQEQCMALRQRPLPTSLHSLPPANDGAASTTSASTTALSVNDAAGTSASPAAPTSGSAPAQNRIFSARSQQTLSLVTTTAAAVSS